MIKFDETEANKRLNILRQREAEELALIMSQKYGVPYIDLTLVAINGDALRLIPEAEAREMKIIAFGRVGKKISVAMQSPDDPKTRIVIQKLQDLGYLVSRYMVSEYSLKSAFEHYKDLSYSVESKAGIFNINEETLKPLIEQATDIGKIASITQEAVSLKRAYRTTRILQVILAGALGTEASDIHFEPEEKTVRMRYRMDGVLVDALTLDNETYHLVLSRFKLLAGLKLNITDQAQDGRFSIKLSDTAIEIRASILPGAYGETMVMRVLNPKSIGVPLEELGMENTLRLRIEKEIEKPNGMILTTGPTGSGKTTTLYAFLRSVNNPDTKIITIEDPIEYHLKGIVQTQVEVEKKYTFASGLRSSLRQDPDIIMVGEIRDAEVATTAINAALTGHLVFSTLHTNDAAGSFPRLIDMGISEKVLSSAVSVAMAQRLVRKLCTQCKKERLANIVEQALIDRVLSGIVNKTLVPQNTHTVWDPNPSGCPTCHQSGYKGRLGVYEAIFMDRTIEEILRTKPSEREIFNAARPQGVPSMTEDGILKVLKGITSYEELKRVVDIEAV